MRSSSRTAARLKASYGKPRKAVRLAALYKRLKLHRYRRRDLGNLGAMLGIGYVCHRIDFFHLWTAFDEQRDERR